MIFKFTPKLAGKRLADLTMPFNGTRSEAHQRATNLASGLANLTGDNRFTVRVDRCDAAMKSYEVKPDGSTV